MSGDAVQKKDEQIHSPPVFFRVAKNRTSGNWSDCLLVASR